jgi:regulator of sigma E protease
MRDFATIQRLVSRNPGKELDVTIRRNDALQQITLIPATKEMTDNFGKVHQYGQIGIKAKQGDLVKHNPVSAVKEAVLTSWQMCGDMLRSLKEIVLGIRSFKEMGGPVKIAQLSGEVAESRNIGHFFFFVAILSLNLGLVNLFPVPALDGGHLLYYAAEGLRGKPLSPKLQEAGAYMGVAMIAMLVVAITWNDVRSVFFSG